MDQHYHPILLQRLRALFEGGDWGALKSYLAGLSNAHFRTAGYLLGERLLPQAPADVFWDVTRELILWHPKAFTVTTGKAALPRLQQGSLSLDDEGFRQLIMSVGEDNLIRRMVCVTADYTEMQFDFTDIKTNEGIPDTRFEYDSPASANVFENFLFEAE